MAEERRLCDSTQQLEQHGAGAWCANLRGIGGDARCEASGAARGVRSGLPGCVTGARHPHKCDAAAPRRHRPTPPARGCASSLPAADASPDLTSTPHTMAVDSPSSFTTAREGDTAFLTPPSTTQASRSSPAPPSNVPQPRYRSAAQLTYELAHHCSVYLESGQCEYMPQIMARLVANSLKTFRASACSPASLSLARSPPRPTACPRKYHRPSCSSSPQH